MATSNTQNCSRRLQAIFPAGFRACPLGNSAGHDRIVYSGHSGKGLYLNTLPTGARVRLQAPIAWLMQEGIT